MERYRRERISQAEKFSQALGIKGARNVLNPGTPRKAVSHRAGAGGPVTDRGKDDRGERHNRPAIDPAIRPKESRTTVSHNRATSCPEEGENLRPKPDAEGGPRLIHRGALEPRPSELKSSAHEVGIPNTTTPQPDREANLGPSHDTMALPRISPPLLEKTPLLAVDGITKPLGRVDSQQSVHRDGREDRLDKHQPSPTREHPSSPTRKFAIHLIQNRLEILAAQLRDGERGSQVGDRELLQGASQVVENDLDLLGGATNRGSRTLKNIRAKARGLTEDLKEVQQSGAVLHPGTDEDHHVVSVEGGKASRGSGAELGYKVFPRGRKEEAVESIHHDDKEHGGQGIPLSQATTMNHLTAKTTIDDDLSARGGEQQTDRVTPHTTKAKVAQEIHEKSPGNRIKSTRNVQLEEHRGLLGDV